MSLLITIGCLFVLVARAQNPFQGHWQLEQGRETGLNTSDQLLQLLGVSDAQRGVIRSLQVVEQYEVGAKTLRLVRDTWYTHTDDTFALGQQQEVHDLVLGQVRQTVTIQPSRILTAVVRADGSLFSSVRRMDPSEQRFACTMNYTALDKRQASAVRYYRRLRTAAALGERLGQLRPVKPTVYASQVHTVEQRQ